VRVAGVELSPEDVELERETLEGWGVATDEGTTVALELELTPELKREGLAREVVRLVQDARKAAGLDVSDRIVLGLEAGPSSRGRWRTSVTSSPLRPSRPGSPRRSSTAPPSGRRPTSRAQP